jgi:hypothetical protein
MNKQGLNCEYEKYLIDALDGVLPESKQDALNEHLKTCASCSEIYQEAEKVHAVLLNRQRPQPAKEVLDRYHAALRSSFERAFFLRRLSSRLKQILSVFSPSPRLIWGLSGGVGMLLIGIVIGRFLFQAQPDKHPLLITVAPPQLSVTDVQFISIFLTQSEIWLMEMVHADNTDGLDRENMEANRELARRLLAKSAFMENKLANMNETSILEFLNRLEMILLETSGVKDQDLDQAFSQIREAIHETALLSEIKNIQKLISTPLREGA